MRFAQWNIGKWTMALYRTWGGVSCFRYGESQFELHLGYVAVYRWRRA